MAQSFSLNDIAQHLDGELIGDGSRIIAGVEAMDKAQPDQITFVRDAKHAHGWATSRAGAAVIGRDIELNASDGRGLIRVANADLGIAGVLDLFEPPPPALALGIHPTAIVDPTATLGDDVRIGPRCYIGPGVSIGAGSRLHHAVTVMDQTQIGANCVFWPGVVVRERTIIGDRCIFHPNAVIGADGFGYRSDPTTGGIRKIPQIGFVHIGNDVEVGANTCVDRGKFSATRVGDQCKLDNLVQIAHNCTLANGVLVAAQSGLAGGVTVGEGAMIGGQVAVRDGTVIGKGAQLGACTGAMQDVAEGQSMAGSPARPVKDALREHLALRKLPDLIKTVNQLQKQLDKLS